MGSSSPDTYDGSELVIDWLSRGLIELGHDVTLLATGDATCPVGRAFPFDHSEPDRMGQCMLELRHVAAAHNALDRLDIIHDIAGDAVFRCLSCSSSWRYGLGSVRKVDDPVDDEPSSSTGRCANPDSQAPKQ